MGAFDSFSQEAKSRRAAEVKATQLRNKKRFQTKSTTKPIYGASRHYLDRDWDGESLGQVYIGNKGWVGITPSGRVGYKTANGYYTPIKNLTDYDKQQITLAVNQTGVKALTGDRSREVANAWSKNSGTWLATKQRIVKPNVTKPQITKNYKATTSTDKPNTSTPPVTSKPRTAPKTPTSNSWINKSRGIWNYNGVSQADVANAYKTGDFSKVGSYLSQHKDLASYLNNIYSKRGGNQFNQSTQTQQTAPIQGTPNRSIHVGNNRVTYTDTQGNTTDVTNSHNLLETIWGKQGQPSVNTQFLEQTATNLINPNQHKFGRGETKDFMRQNLVNPEDYSTSEIRAFRHSISNDTGDWSNAGKIMSDARINNKLSQSINIPNGQLKKPQLNMPFQLDNNLVNLKFKQGGQMYKYAAGAQMVQPQQTNSQDPIDQIAQIAAGSLQGDENSKQQLIQVLSNKEIAPKLLQIVDAGVKNQDKRAIIIAQAIKSLQQGSTRKARLGAKLDYIKQSIGECPEGQEVVYFKKGGEICKVCAGKKMQDGGKSDPIKNFKKKKEQDAVKQAYQRNPYTRGKSAKEIAEMQRRNRQEASAGKGENDAKVAPWNYKKKR